MSGAVRTRTAGKILMGGATCVPFILMVSASSAALKFAALGAAAALVLLALAMNSEERGRQAQLVIWFGLLAPLSFPSNRTRDEITESFLNATALLEGALPVACLAIAWWLFPLRLGPSTRLEQLLFGYLGFVLASSLWSVWPLATLLKGVNLVTVYLLVLLLVRIHEYRSDSLEDLARVVHLLLLLTSLELALAPGIAMSLDAGDPTPVNRLRGIFPYIHPNFLGLLAATGIVLVIAKVGPRWTRRPLVSPLLLSGYGLLLLLTRTRSSLAILLAAVIVLMLSLWHLRPILLLVAPAACAAVLVVASIASRPIADFLSRGQSQEGLTTLTGRTASWGGALDRWHEGPILGFGYYAGERLSLEQERGSGQLYNLDSLWVATLLDVGVLGLIPLVGVVGYAGVLLFSRQRRDHYVAFRRALFVACLMASFINPSLQEHNYPMLLFAIVIFGRDRLARRGPRPTQDRSAGFLGPVMPASPDRVGALGPRTRRR